MDNMTPLSMNEMEQVVGGAGKTIKTGTAIVYAGANTASGQVATLERNEWVNFTGNVSYSDADGMSFYEINAPVYGWVTKKAIGA